MRQPGYPTFGRLGQLRGHEVLGGLAEAVEDEDPQDLDEGGGLLGDDDLEDFFPGAPAPTTKKKKPSNARYYLIGGVGVLAIIGLGAAVVLR